MVSYLLVVNHVLSMDVRVLELTYCLRYPYRIMKQRSYSAPGGLRWCTESDRNHLFYPVSCRSMTSSPSLRSSSPLRSRFVLFADAPSDEGPYSCTEMHGSVSTSTSRSSGNTHRMESSAGGGDGSCVSLANSMASDTQVYL